MRHHNHRTARQARVTAGAAGLALLALLASGCSGAEPGVVAYVGDTKITQQELDDAVEGVGVALAGQQVSPQAVTNALIHGALAEDIAAANNITISDTERDGLIKGSNLAPLLGVPEAVVVAYDVADQELVARKLGDAAYLEAIGQAKVTLNPRMGVLDPAQKTIVTDQSGSLAEPVIPEPSP